MLENYHALLLSLIATDLKKIVNTLPLSDDFTDIIFQILQMNFTYRAVSINAG